MANGSSRSRLPRRLPPAPAFVLVLVLVLVAIAATPALAQGAPRPDYDQLAAVREEVDALKAAAKYEAALVILRGIDPAKLDSEEARKPGRAVFLVSWLPQR